MKPTEEITPLLEMLEKPEAFSEQDIRNLTDGDTATHDAYRTMVAARQSYRRRQTNQPIDVDAAWKRFETKHAGRGRRAARFKIAASFVGVLFASCLAVAAIHNARQSAPPTPPVSPAVQPKQNAVSTLTTDTVKTDTTTAKPIVFDNVPFEKIVVDMAAYYHVEPVFRNEEVRSLRFYFVWYREQSLEKVVSVLNRFERVNMEIDNRKLIVK